MSDEPNYINRKYILGGIAVAVVIIYLIRLFSLQLMSDDYKKNADSNAFRKEIQYPSRGLILDRKGRLLVYNESSYNIMVVMNDQRGIDTLDFCQTVGITKDFYIKRMDEIKSKISYSRYTPQRSSPFSARNSSASKASPLKNAPFATTPLALGRTFSAMSEK